MLQFAETARIRRRAFLAGAAGVAIIAVGAWMFTREVKSAFLDTKGADLGHIAATIANGIIPADQRSVVKSADEGSDAYLRIAGDLEEFQRSNPSVRAAYTMRIRGDDASLIVSPPADLNRNGVIDGDAEARDAVGTPLGTKPSPAMLQAAAGRASADRNFTSDRWGTWLTACAPIGKATEGTADVVCVDEDQASVEESMLRMNAMAGTLAFVAALLLFGMLVAYVRLKAELGMRKVLEEEREASLTGFIAAIEHLGAVALQSFDRDGSIRVWNRACEKLFGIPSGEAIGGDISTILSLEADASAFKKTLDEIYSSGKAPPPRERTIVSRDGTRRRTLSSMFPIKEGGEITEILCLDVDITGRS
ncbi:MAG TPA: PAS domain-containing protein [bacterium]|nr:PAS domain-containing protein [bacterium]